MKFETGRRYIAREDRPLGRNIEVKVLEISPSKKYMKLKFPLGGEDWEKVSDWLIVEELE